MSDSFNLVDEPWIAVQRPDGRLEEVSLRRVFAEAGEIRSLSGDLSTQAFAIIRLLLALLYCSVDIDDRTDWVRLWRDGLPLDRIDDYLDDHRYRFDLFDPVAPFYQVPDLRTAKGEVGGLESIIADVPNRPERRLLSLRAGAGLLRITAAEAARWLVHVHAFDPSGIRSAAVGDPLQKAGKGYPIGPAWAGHLGGIVITGLDLRETLLLNLVPLDRLERPDADDLAPWEQPPATEQRADLSEAGPRGIVDLYTFQSRRVRLVGGPTGVTGVVLTQGDKLIPQNRFGLEPMTAWRYSKNQSDQRGHVVYMPREHRADRAMWRNTAALLPAGAPGSTPVTRAPLTTAWLRDVNEVVGGHRRVGLTATGMVYGANQSVTEEVIDDSVDLAVSLLGQAAPEAAALVDDAVRTTEGAVREVSRLAENLARAAGERGDDPGAGPRVRAAEDGYARVDQPFRRWLSALTGTADREVELGRWEVQVDRIVHTQAQELLDAAGPAALVGREVAGTFVNASIAEMWFRRRLDTVLPRVAAARTAMAQQHANTSPALAEGER